jgi:hypothetical protein
VYSYTFSIFWNIDRCTIPINGSKKTERISLSFFLYYSNDFLVESVTLLNNMSADSSERSSCILLVPTMQILLPGHLKRILLAHAYFSLVYSERR